MESERIKSLIYDLGAQDFKRGIDWKGNKVFIPVYKGNPTIGLPLVVFEKDGEARISTDEESLEYLSYEQSHIDGTNEDIL